MKFVNARLRIMVICLGLLLTTVVWVSRAYGLSLNTSSITFAGVTLNGNDQVISGSTNPWRVDATGEATGWNLSVASSDFENGSGKTIAVSNFEVRLLDTNIVVVSGDANGPISTLTMYNPLNGAPIKIASAATGDGDGVYDLTPDFRLLVPAESYTGNYSATLTVMISTGP